MTTAKFNPVNSKVYPNWGTAKDDGITAEEWKKLPVCFLGFDSTQSTLLHIKRVSTLLVEVSKEFLRRSQIHDTSKLYNPERKAFDKATPQLMGLKYGSNEYKEALANLGVALKHHYDHNDHHPEHYGLDPASMVKIYKMNLFSVLEMLVDWIAAGERHANGSIFKSLEVNKERFNIEPQLYHILYNTVTFLHENYPIFLDKSIHELDLARRLEALNNETDDNTTENEN